jgi:RNA methyltransferase, TrmH family
MARLYLASKLSYSGPQFNVISKNDIKVIRSLHRKKQRDDMNLFLVEGEKLVDELLLSEIKVKSVYCLAQSTESIKSDWLVITPREMSQISTHSPLLAVAYKLKPEPDIKKLSNQKILVLDGIRDPGNLGTIIRTADWFGIHSIIASKDTVDCYNPKVVQATMGGLFRCEMHYEDLSVLLELKKLNSSFRIFGAVLSGQDLSPLAEYKSSAGALIIGNESLGISEPVQLMIDHQVTIPRKGVAESLNAAISASILLHEWSN